MEKSKRKNARHPIYKRQEDIYKEIKGYIKSDTIRKQLKPSGCGVGKLYGTSKVHKQGYPVRPIVSMINTPEYKLAKHLDKVIKPHIPGKYLISSNAEFLQRLHEFEQRDGDWCISFDIVSLFTNIPLKETINIIANDMHPDESEIKSRMSLVKVLECATGGIFSHRGKLFQQRDGVTMGNPLAPTLANYMLGHLEKTLFDHNLEDSQPAFYSRYVDDIFCVFRKGIGFQDFLARLNGMHDNIKFTYEIGGNSMPFLDVMVTLDVGSITSTVFRKKTNTNVLLNYNSVCPTSWKKGLIKCFLHRANTVCSDDNQLMQEINKLKNIFQSNGYPETFFDKAKNEYMEKIRLRKKDNLIKSNENDEKNKTNSPDPNSSLEDKIVEFDKRPFLKIPFIGRDSILYGRRVQNLLRKENYTDFRIVYETTKIQDSFKLKDASSKEIVSKIVYRYTCPGDQDVQYIGYSKRSLRERFLEHRRGQSAISEHASTCQYCKTRGILMNDFEILRRCRTKTEAMINEAFLIKKHNPILNRQLIKPGQTYTLQIFF